MADSSDFNVDKIRRAISTTLVDGPLITDPPSGEKDTGFVVGGTVDAASNNSAARDTYVFARWVEEDMLPGTAQWGGLLGTEAAGAGLVTDGVANFTVDVAAGRFRLGGGTYTVAAAAAAYPTSAFVIRQDWVVVEVDLVARTASYVVVPGTVEDTLPALAANQIPLAIIRVLNGPGGANPADIHDVRFRPGPPRARTDTIIYSREDFVQTLGDTLYIYDDDEGSVQIGDLARILIPVHLPVGTRIDAVRMRGLKNAPALAGDSNELLLRRRDTRAGTTPSAEALSVTSSSLEPLSATPYEVSNAAAVLHPVVLPGYAYGIIVSHNVSATVLANRTRFWAVEVDVTYGLTP